MFRRKIRLPAATIGICSLQHNTGSTFFSFACANYLCSKKRQPTACVECNSTHTFRKLHPGNEEFFSMHGIHLYPEDPCPFPSNHSYQWIVKDFGVLTPSNRAEFLRCDLRLCILDLSPWKRSLSEELYLRCFGTGSKREHITLLGNPAPLQPLELSSPLAGHSLIPLPYISNPFRLTPDDFGVFEKIWKELIYHK